jgi:hypothetical protein
MRTCPPPGGALAGVGAGNVERSWLFPHYLNPISVMSESVLICVPLLRVLCVSAVRQEVGRVE